MFVCIIFFLAVSGFVKEKHKHGALESSGVALESLFPQNNGALESSSVSLEPDSRKKMSRWNLTPLGTLKL